MANIMVTPNTTLCLRLLVGGAMPNKWQLFEFAPPDWTNSTPNGVQGESEEKRDVGPIASNDIRKFAWSVVIVSNDPSDTTIEIRGQVLDDSGTVLGSVSGPVTVKKPYTECFVNLAIEGK